MLCPGINDGPDLIGSLSGFLSEFKNIISIGIVPVGITGFNSSKILKSFDKKSALKTIKSVNSFKTNENHLNKSERIYISDEFYILAEIDFPDYKSYGDFCQLENGIGKGTEFLNQIKDALKQTGKTTGKKRFIDGEVKKLIITSEYGEILINKSLNILRSSRNITKKELSCLEVLVIKNIFFGGNIKATGLLAGSDIISNLGKIDLNKYGKILIPDSIFNNEDQTLDNFSRKQIEKLNMNIEIIPENGESFFKYLFY